MAPISPAATSSRVCTSSVARRVAVFASGSPGQTTLIAPSSPPAVVSQSLLATASSVPKPMLVLSPATTTAASAYLDASLPGTFARVVVGAALALSTVYTLLSSSASTSTGAAFASSTISPPRPTDADATTSSATVNSTTATTTPSSAATPAVPAVPSLPILTTPEQFDAFVLASNRAGYLAIVLFHAPWCSASTRMENELQRLSRLVASRRVVFARVDCSLKLASRSSNSMNASMSMSMSASSSLASVSMDGAQVRGLGAGLERCGMTQLHRVHKTPTVRMYYGNTCVDEVIGCRPVDFRQAVSDLTFKYQL